MVVLNLGMVSSVTLNLTLPRLTLFNSFPQVSSGQHKVPSPPPKLPGGLFQKSFSIIIGLMHVGEEYRLQGACETENVNVIT